MAVRYTTNKKAFFKFKIKSFFIALTLVMVMSLTSGIIMAKESKMPIPTVADLGGESRTLLFLTTDKPIYKPGETVYARAVILQADTFFPYEPANNRPMPVALKIKGPKDNELGVAITQAVNSTAGFSWVIPNDASGGRYQAQVTMGGSPISVRPFEVRSYIPPRLNSQIEFLREGYGPGDEVTAKVKVTRAEGGIPVGAKVTALARVDEAEVARVENLLVGSNGESKVSFKLPKAMERGEGSLAFIIDDGGVSVTATKTIPILLQTIDINFYPEGGDLVAGLSGRVYVQATRPDGKPADLKGEIVKINAQGQALADRPAASLTTVHEGRGIMEFTPLAKEKYALKIIEPTGINKLFPLPEPKSSGVSLKALKPTYDFSEPVTLQINSTADSNAAKITLYQRENLAAEADLKPGLNEISLAADEAEGVLMATVWNKSGQPLAERLVFRKPRFAVTVDITAENISKKKSFSPGDKVKLKITAKDINGKPVEAVVGLAVTDESLLEMVETRDQAPSLPVMVYLENEVKDLADAQVYFDQKNPQANLDVDLLLGTQGWRRFILAHLDEAMKSHPEEVKRALAVHGPIPVFVHDEDRIFDNQRRAAFPMAADMKQPVPTPAFPMMDAMEKPAPIAPPEAEGIVAEQAPHADFELEQGMAIGRLEMNDQMANKKRMAPPRQRMVPIREYAHKVRDGRKPNDRADFTETIYWNAGIRTNPRTGQATVEFGLSDSVTTFKIRGDAFGNNGALGQVASDLISVEPFYTETKLPPLVMSGDILNIPAVLVNPTDEPLESVGLLVKADKLKFKAPVAPTKLAPGERFRVLVGLEPEIPGDYTLTLNSAAGSYADTVTRKFKVVPRGFPVHLTSSGILGPDKPTRWSFKISEDMVPNSINATAKIYVSPLANMEEALNALLRQPHGCFEQTSSTSYPLVMAQQYFTSHSGIDPEKIKKAEGLLDESYKQLISFESPEKGYEWFGGNPGHEALTAYGLMQFTEMQQIRSIDQGMVDRTKAWLMSRRDGKGGFKRNELALDSFGGAPAPVTNLYILWTLLESGEKTEGLKVELEAAKKIMEKTKDPYQLALGLNIFNLVGDKGVAKEAALALRKLQAKDGSLDGAETSITRSAGEALLIETTSLTIIGWLRSGDEFAGDVEKAMAWLFERCKAGRFGSTQSTILALKAINAYDAARSKPKEPGKVQLLIDGKPFGEPANFDKNTKDALELPDFAAKLTPGEHSLELVMTGGGDMPYALEIAYNTPKPDDSPACPLTLGTALSTHKIKEGELVDLTVTIKAQAETPLPLAIIGLPAGLEPRHERMKELIKAGQIASYEILDRDLVLYWRNFKPGETVKVVIPMTAEIPGQYTGPASRAYGYYLEEHKNWQAGEQIEVVPR